MKAQKVRVYRSIESRKQLEDQIQAEINSGWFVVRIATGEDHVFVIFEQ